MQYELVDRCEISISQIAIDLDPFTWYSLLVRRQVSKIVKTALPIYSESTKLILKSNPSNMLCFVTTSVSQPRWGLSRYDLQIIYINENSI